MPPDCRGPAVQHVAVAEEDEVRGAGLMCIGNADAIVIASGVTEGPFRGIDLRSVLVIIRSRGDFVYYI